MAHHKTGVRYVSENSSEDEDVRVAEFVNGTDAREFADWWEETHDSPTTVFTLSEVVE